MNLSIPSSLLFTFLMSSTFLFSIQRSPEVLGSEEEERSLKVDEYFELVHSHKSLLQNIKKAQEALKEAETGDDGTCHSRKRRKKDPTVDGWPYMEHSLERLLALEEIQRIRMHKLRMELMK